MKKLDKFFHENLINLFTMSYLTVDRQVTGTDKSGDEGNNDDLEVWRIKFLLSSITFRRFAKGKYPWRFSFIKIIIHSLKCKTVLMNSAIALYDDYCLHFRLVVCSLSICLASSLLRLYRYILLTQYKNKYLRRLGQTLI